MLGDFATRHGLVVPVEIRSGGLKIEQFKSKASNLVPLKRKKQKEFQAATALKFLNVRKALRTYFIHN